MEDVKVQSKNEGEGSQTGAKQYNDATRAFAQSGAVKPKADEAKRAIEGTEGEELRKAEEVGKSHAKGEDPALKR